MSERGAKPGRYTLTFLCCLLGLPACAKILPGVSADTVLASLGAGAMLGAAYLVIRPLARLLTFPLGCLTFGLFNFVIDVGLILLASNAVDGFAVAGAVDALLSAVLVNALIAVTGGFR